MAGQSGGKNNRKYGRNSAFCKMYKDRGTREINKKRKMRRHLKRFPEDTQAIERAKGLFFSDKSSDKDILEWADPS